MTDTTTDTPMRRCVGSERFGIPTHEAPTDDFPLQPSGKDGLGRMCKPHWTEYTRGLRLASGGGQPTKQVAPVPEGKAGKAAKPVKAAKARAPRIPRRGTESAAIEEARAVLAAADKLGGRAYLDAVATDEVQDALRVMAATSSGPEIHEAMGERLSAERHAVHDESEAARETPLGETIDSGTEEVDDLEHLSTDGDFGDGLDATA